MEDERLRYANVAIAKTTTNDDGSLAGTVEQPPDPAVDAVSSYAALPLLMRAC